MPPQLSESDVAELEEKAHPDFWAFYRQKRAYWLDVTGRGRSEDNDNPVAPWVQATEHG